MHDALLVQRVQCDGQLLHLVRLRVGVWVGIRVRVRVWPAPGGA